MDAPFSDSPVIIATHDGRFHADEVLAVSILLELNPGARIVRSRNADDWKDATYLVDAGKVSDGKRFFDHHQRGGAGKRRNGVPYAASGLIWKAFGRQYLQSVLPRLGEGPFDVRAFWQRMDIEIIQGVDAIDCGEAYIGTFLRDAPSKTYLHVPSLSGIVGNFNPVQFLDSKSDEDMHFMRAVAFMTEQLDLLVRRLVSEHLSSAVIARSYREQGEPEILYLDKPYNWKAVFREAKAYHGVKYVIAHFEDDGRYRVYPSDSRKSSPYLFEPSWRGRLGRDLIERTGVESADNCHVGGILLVTRTREGAYEVARQQLAKLRDKG